MSPIKHNKKNLILNIDSRRILDSIGDTIQIKTTITSPPYFDMKDYGSENQIGFGQSYGDYLNDLKKIFSDIYKITELDGSLWIVIDSFKRDNQVVTLPFDLSKKLQEAGWLLQDIIIWKKDKTVPWSNKGFLQRKFEYILFFTKTNEFKYNKDKVRNYDTDQLKKWWVKYPERYNPKGKALDEVWEFPIPVQGSWGDKYIRHFCPLPKEMVATMIEISTDPDDLVLDPFAGSGSVLFQSAAMGRKFIGFELNKEYIEMFRKYMKSNLIKAESDYKGLKELGTQEEFKRRILNLRALKYGRLLVNELEQIIKLDLKIFVKIVDIHDNERFHLKVEYQILGLDSNFDYVSSQIDSIVSKPPFSKFGIEPKFILKSNINVNNSKYFRYTKSNSYSHVNLPASSLKVKVVSDICVDLNENDYN